MIIGYLNVFRAGFGPFETNAVLVVDPDTMLPAPVAPQKLKSVSGRDFEIVQRDRRIDLIQLSERYVPQVARQ